MVLLPDCTVRVLVAADEVLMDLGWGGGRLVGVKGGCGGLPVASQGKTMGCEMSRWAGRGSERVWCGVTLGGWGIGERVLPVTCNLMVYALISTNIIVFSGAGGGGR